jgi:hypothetical protein
MSEFSYVDVGRSRFHAETIARACRAEGLVVELLGGDDDGTFPGVGALQPHRLLIRSADLDRVRAVIDRTKESGNN